MNSLINDSGSVINCGSMSMNKTNLMLSLNDILQLFNSAISQEQAWAVLYQTLKEYKYLFETSLYLININQNYIDLNAINFRKDGSVYINFKYNVKTIQQQQPPQTYINTADLDRNVLETKILKSLAYLIYDALDYGNKFETEPDLQSSLSDLLLMLTGHYNDYNNDNSHKVSEDDEGYEQEDEDTQTTTTISLDKAFMICKNNVTESAEYHYKAVCRALYAQAYELKVFLDKIEDSKNILLTNGKDESHYCFEVLNRSDWAKLWMQVIHELRNGVKLRKVGEVNVNPRRHIEYELTPFEILLDQIRSRRYSLKKVVMDNQLAPEIKKDARDIILEFIRSRPPLKPVKIDNKNRNTRSEPLSIHEKLMQSIRTYSTPLRKTHSNIEHVNNRSNGNFNGNCSTNTKQSNSKRLLKADKNISYISDDEEIDEKDLIYIQNLSTFNAYSLNNSINDNNNYHQFQVPPRYNHHQQQQQQQQHQQEHQQQSCKKRIKPPESLTKSPLSTWNEPIEDWRALVTEDIFDGPHSTTAQINDKYLNANNNRYHTMNIFDLNTLNIFSSNYKSAKSRQQQQHQQHQHPIDVISDKKITNSTDCLQLSFDELCHIRNVLTKAELDYLLFDNTLFYDVSRGKICFSCRKTRFHIFYWGYKCRICKQRVCKKCLREVQILNGTTAQVPLSKLCPSKYGGSVADKNNKDKDNNSETSNNSSINDNDSELSNDTQDDINQSKKIDYDDYELKCQIESSNSEYLQICVDCYDMLSLSGVTIREHKLFSNNNTNNSTINTTNNHESSSSNKQININNSSLNQKYDNNSFNSQHSHDSCNTNSTSSPESLVMTPLFVTQPQQSSTITSTTTTDEIMINDEQDSLSSINTINDSDNCRKSTTTTSLPRNNLTLNLKPVY